MSADQEPSLGAIIDETRKAGVELWAEGNRLRFRAPPGALSPEAREALRTRRDEIVAALRREATEVSVRAPMAANQIGVWLAQRVAPESAAYNVAFAARVLGVVDSGALEEAFQVLIDRHEALRTSYLTGADFRPVRQIVGHAPFRLEIVESGHRSEEEVRDDVQASYRRPFQLEQTPLIRGQLFRQDAERHILLLNAHHLAVDGQSLFVLLGELFDLYEALLDGKVMPSRGDGAAFSDFVTWQASEVLGDEEAKAYWERVLDPAPAPLELPIDRARVATPPSSGGTVPFQVDPTIAEPLRALAAAEGATEYVVILAAWSAYLGRLTRAVDVTVGTPVQGRPSVRFERTVGDFVNVTPLRVRFERGATFREHVRQVREVATGAMAHQDYPLPLMGAGRSASGGRGAPFDTLLAFQDFKSHGALERLMLGIGDSFRFGRLTLAPYTITQQEGQFPLALEVWKREGGWWCTCKYDAGIFDEATVRRRVSELVTFMRSVATAPDASMETADLLPREDVEALAAINRTDRDWPWVGSVPALVAEAARRYPDNLAVRSPTGDWTYAELVDYAQRVAEALRQMGVGAGDRVVILMERSREMLGALLGVLGSGAAYVPIDPRYPEARVRYVIENAKATAVLTHRSLDRRFHLGVRVLDLDAWSQPEPSPFHATESTDTAYVIYTSGSTGKPKGVEIAHSALVNFLRSMTEKPALDESDVVLAVTTIAFDIAVLELLLPLVVGARVVIADEREVMDARALARRLDEEGITFMQATPATWKLLIASGWEGRRNLRVLCGGEALSRSLADDLLSRVAELWNMYGPTETTVWSTLHRVEPEAPILIGHPIANTTVHLLDEEMRPVPIGVAGELWIGGAGVAKGYDGRPDLTAERFVPDLHRKGGLMYRTGDLARFREDARLEHLGRLDHQVKIRGFRVELGEIESTMRDHPGVREAVVVAWQERLVAYLVYELDAPSVGQLRTWLLERLPEYMIPSLFMPVEAIPLTPNGKVDRKRLPQPGFAAQETSFEEPSRPNQRLMAQIWSEVLSVDRVGLRDNFFELGGHSLLAMEVVGRIEERTGHRIEPRALFFKTLGQLADSLPTESHRSGSAISN